MIYIIIPVHNRIAYTRTCLACLIKQKHKDYGIIVVDDGSTDGTSDMIEREFKDVNLLRGDGNLWWAGAINKGINYVLSKCTDDDYILALNDDLIVNPDYLNKILQASKSARKSLIGSVETTVDEPLLIKSGGMVINWKNAKINRINKGRNLHEFPIGHVEEVSSLTGRGTLFPINFFKEIGLFDAVHIKQCADTELPIKAHLKHGFSLYVCYDAVVISQIGDRNNINNKQYYSLSDAKEYFWGVRSHFNISNRYRIARNIAPNDIWFLRYYLFDVARTIGRFIRRLRLISN